MKKKSLDVLGIAMGAAAIIAGFVIMGNGESFINTLGKAEFGADFYTEIYAASYSINSFLVKITSILNSVLDAIGWAFVFFGASNIIKYAKYYISSPEDIETLPTTEDVTPTSETV